MTSLAPQTEDAPRFSESRYWALFCVSIFAFKALLLAADPQPKFMMGDSGSYIWTALSGWIPDDRSFLYGFVIRWTSVWTQSLAPLLIVQAGLSAITCILFASICRSIFKLPLGWSCLFGLLCAIDPLQLLWERYVMTEAISLCLYAFVIRHSLLYLRDRRLRDLVIVQVVSVLLIAFRMSFLLQVQIGTIILPILAFAPAIWEQLRRPSKEEGFRASALRVWGGHLLVSIALLFLLHGGYKRFNGWISEREPAYLYGTGLVFLCYWSPILQPEDAADPRLADLIRIGDEFELRNPDLRNSQRFSPGFLLDRWSKIETDPWKADRLARKTAQRALRRDPLGVLAIAWRTYSNYWNAQEMKESAELDFSFTNPPSGDFLALVATNFHHTHPNDQTKSLLQRYYVAAWPYYSFILLAPLLSALTILLRRTRSYALLLFIHISIMMSTSMTFGSDSVRYFQPISFVTLLVLALGTSAVVRQVRRKKEAAISDEPKADRPVDSSLPAKMRTLAPPALVAPGFPW
jgi:hypothetical protein